MMSFKTTISQRAPQARCYKCGNPDIQYICHHCGRPMCEKHTCFVSVHQASNNNNYTQKKLLSTEFKGLSLRETECGEEPYHCEEHFHIVSKVAWKRIMIGVILCFISLFFIPNNQLKPKLLLLLTGGGIASYGIYSNQQRKNEILNNKPYLPLLPTFDKISILETLNAEIKLDSEGNYHTILSEMQGQLDICMSLNPQDLERLKLYRKKYKSISNYHAGFAILQGEVGISFKKDFSYLDSYFNTNGVLIPLINQVQKQPYLNGEDKRNSNKEHISNTYSLVKNPSIEDFPIQLVLCFLSESDQRGIEIRVQKYYSKPTDNDKFNRLNIKKIGLLELKFPVNWGKFINSSDSNCVNVNQENQKIRWEQVLVEDHNDQFSYHSFKVKFENRISPLESSIHGKVKVIFNSTFSGLENVSIYFPTGNKPDSHRALEREQTVEAELDIDFEMSLSTLRYQHTKKIPDDTKSIKRSEDFTFQGVSPNYKTIILITNEISEQGFYVKQVIENPSTTEAMNNINLVKQRWTIFGRWYDGVFPIDFQLYLNGQETDKLDAKSLVDYTTVTLTVTGNYSNQEMETLIENQSETLNDIIRETLEEIAEETLSYQQEYLPPSSDEFSIDAEIIEDSDDGT